MRQYPLHRFTGEGRARFVTIIAPNRLMSEDASSKNSNIKQRAEGGGAMAHRHARMQEWHPAVNMVSW